MPNTEESLKKINELRVDALYGKKKHFNAADRKQRLHLQLGIPAIIINIFVASILFGYLSQAFPEYLKWIGAILAFIGAALTGVQTFFNYQKDAEGHRRMATRFLSIAKSTDRLIAYYSDGAYSPDELRKQFEELADEYQKVCQDAELFPTSDEDYRIAQKGFNAGEEVYTHKELNSPGR